MKKGLLLIGVMMLTLSASAQKFWTLQDCIDYAMENNITLQKSKLDKSTATETLKGSKAALLPTLNASTNQNLGYQPWKDTGMAYVSNGTVNTKVDKTSYNGSYSLNGQWTNSQHRRPLIASSNVLLRFIRRYFIWQRT